MEMYVFRSCKQKPGQSLEAYVTELRALAQTYTFHDANSEILSQLIHHCSSLRFRRWALREQDKSLSDILAMGRLLEQSDAQAKLMEDGPATVKAVQTAKPRFQSQKHSSKHRSSGICKYCGGQFPHSADTPARGKTCNFCHKKDHFERVCQTKARSQQSQHVKSVSTAPADTDSNSPISQPPADSSSDEYCYAFQEETVSAVTPQVTLMVEHIPISFLVDRGRGHHIKYPPHVLSETRQHPKTDLNLLQHPSGIGRRQLNVLTSISLGKEHNKGKKSQMFRKAKHDSGFKSHSNARHRFMPFRLLMSGKRSGIDVTMDRLGSERRNKNREVLKSIVETVLLCGRQNCVLRGHRDDSQYHDVDSNCGNFRAFLEFRSNVGDSILKEHLKSAREGFREGECMLFKGGFIVCHAHILSGMQMVIINSLDGSLCFMEPLMGGPAW